MEVFQSIGLAVLPVLIIGAFAVSTIAITVVKEQKKQLEQLERRLAQLERQS